MHVVLVSAGTDGDVIPYIGLGARLLRRGHQVTLVAGASHRSAAERHGFAFHALFSDDEMHAILANPVFWRPIRGPIVAARWGASCLERQTALLADIVRGASDVVLVANPGVFAARIIHDQFGIPIASVVLQPWMIPSLHEPPVMPVGLTLPRWAPRPIGRMYWGGYKAVGDWLVARPLNHLRSTRGLPALGSPVMDWWMSPQRVIGMFPAWYAAPQPDWPATLELTGFPMYDGRPAEALSDEVRAFCDAGDPPLVFTFGTGMMHARDAFRAAVDAGTRLGRRIVLLTRYPQQIPQPLPTTARHFEFVPLQGLLPACAAIVHHGGVGTTAKSLAAGLPQLVLPWSWDQPDNAARLKRMGVGDSLDPRRVTGRKLAERLAPLLSSAVRERCREIAARFGAPDALEQAANCVERMSAGKMDPTGPGRL